MNWLQNSAKIIIDLTPPWFFNFLAFSSSLWVRMIASLALLFLIRTVYVFFKTKRKMTLLKKNNREELADLVKEKGIDFPMFSIVVPARNEVDVVRNTIINLTRLNYPQNRFEIIVITDEKEKLAAKDNEVITKQVVEETMNFLAKENSSVKIISMDVPFDFDGEFLGVCTGREIKSTKGRALNYVFTENFDHFNKNTDFFAFFDTDDHPDKNCLLEIAKENLKYPHKKVFQMPVFQCRNFWKISTFSKIIALGQCFTHEFFLPWIMTWLPFLGGTNLFIQKDILFAVKGFNYHSITEDLDLGVTIYLETNTWPYYLPYPSTEQTPENVKTFLKQRHRWALGQLEVIKNLKKMKNNKTDIGKKASSLFYKLCFYGPLEWTVFFLLTILSVFVLVTNLIKNVILLIGMNQWYGVFSVAAISKQALLSVLSIAGLPMLLFSLLLLLHYSRFVEYPTKNIAFFLKFLVFMLKTCFLIPFVVFLYPLPFFSAFVKYSLGYYKKRELVWVKTPRTKE